MLTLNSESPSVEKKVSSVIEKNQIDIVSTSDKKKVTPTKIIKTNEGGRRPGPKSRTCVPQLKTEKTTSSLLKKNEINPQQAGSNNVDLTDTDEAKSKKINIATKEEKMNEDAMTNSLINSVHTDNVIVKIEKKEIKLTTNLHQLDNGAKFDIVEENTIIRNHLEKEKNESIKTKVKEVTPEPKEDEDNIHNEELDHEMYEELDHEMYEELDHEFDEEEIIESSVGPNQTDTVKAVQEHNKDENNEDSINLTIGEEDIKLFADEEDTNIEKEDEVIGNQTDEKTSLIKQRESCHPVTSSRLSTGLVKSRRNATEKRSSIGDKLRSTHKEDKDISNAKPIINTLKDEKKEGEKQIKDKVETGNKQRFVLNMVVTTDSLSLH